MSSEPEQNDQATTWEMQPPVFRTSPGVTPKNVRRVDDNAPVEQVPETDNAKAADVKPETVKVKAAAPKAKKGGCARGFLAAILLIAILATIIVGATIYFLFYYTPTPAGPF